MSDDRTLAAVTRRFYRFVLETRTGVLLRWAVVLGVAVVVWYFSVLSTPPSGSASRSLLDLLPAVAGFDTSQWRHILAYAGLAHALAFAIRHWRLPRWQRGVLVIAAASTYGLSIEIAQSFTPDRVFDTRDIVANTVGAMLVIPWYVLSGRVAARRDTPSSE